MKLFIGIIFVFISSYLGYCASSKYIIRRKFYQSFYDFNKTMQSEVTFSKNSINKIIDENTRSPFCSLVKNRLILNKEYAIDSKYSDTEKCFIQNYIENLGNSDSLTQIAFLNSAESNIKKQLNDCILEEKKYKSLYVKLGFLVGAVILIILL